MIQRKKISPPSRAAGRPVAIVESGKPSEKEMSKDSSSFSKENKLTIIKGPGRDELSFKLDPSQKPKSIDIADKDRITQGIYSVEGDMLKICLPSPTGKRPTEIQSDQGMRFCSS